MAATTRDSLLYTKLYTNKYVADARDFRGRPMFIPISHTVVSGEVGGASAGARDKVRVCVLPAECMVVRLDLTGDAIWASAGTNGTLQLGDSDDDDRYMTATEFFTAAGAAGVLAFAGQNYRPSVETIVLAEYRAANPVVGKIFRGGFTVVMPA